MSATSGEPSPDYLRRLREFQIQVRQRPKTNTVVVPARAPFSGRDAVVMERLRRLSESLAQSLEQSLRDLNDPTRLSYIGPAGELREVMRAAIQQLAPDAEIRKQPWYKGVPASNGKSTNPSQAERARYAAQVRGGNPEQVKELDGIVEGSIGRISRDTYTVSSKSFHSGAAQEQVRKLTGWIFAILDEVLPE
jgi:hypothetical protein